MAVVENALFLYHGDFVCYTRDNFHRRPTSPNIELTAAEFPYHVTGNLQELPGRAGNTAQMVVPFVPKMTYICTESVEEERIHHEIAIL